MKRLAILGCVPALAILAACSTDKPVHLDRYSGHVLEANEDQVVGCKVIDTLSSSSGLVGFFAPKGVDNIKQNLLRQADAMGATHVVWDKPQVSYDSTNLSGKAYRCPSKEHP